MSWLVSSSENWVLEHRPVLAAIQELLLVWLCVQTMKDLWGPREATAQLHDRILFPANAVRFTLPAWCIKQPPTFPSGPLCCSLVPLFHLTRWQKWCSLAFRLDSTSKMQARPDSWEWHSQMIQINQMERTFWMGTIPVTAIVILFYFFLRERLVN